MARQKLRKPHAPDPSGEPELVQVLLPRAIDKRRVARGDRLPRLAGLEGREADGPNSRRRLMLSAMKRYSTKYRIQTMSLDVCELSGVEA